MEKINIVAGLFKAFAFESITVGQTAVSFTLNTFTTSDSQIAKKANITVEGAQIRFRYDSTNPTSSVGHILNPNDRIIIIGSDNIKNFRGIRTGATNATLMITYEI